MAKTGTKAYKGTDRHGRHVWRLRVWDGTRQLTETLKVAPGPNTGVKAADKALRAFVRRVESNGPGGPVTLEKLSERWLDSLESRLSPTTLRDYRGKMRVILGTLGPLRIDQLRAYELDAFYADEGKRGVAPATVIKYHRILSSMYRQAERWDLVGESPTRNARAPHLVRGDTTTPSLDLVLALVRTADTDEARLVILLAAALGARRGELCGLRWEDVDKETVTIRRSVYEVPGGGVGIKDTKTEKPRQISIDPQTAAALEAVRGCGYVFGGREPWRPDHMTKTYAKVRDSVLGAKGVRLHDLRHWHATQLIAAGLDPVTVSKRLGHADVTTTLNIYSSALSERDRAASTVIGNLLASPR